MTRRLAVCSAVLGGTSLLLAVGWWWVVFRVLIGNASMTVQGALFCLARQSDLCILAQALCTSQHFLGIRHYDTVIFWAGAALIAASLLPALTRRHELGSPAR